MVARTVLQNVLPAAPAATARTGSRLAGRRTSPRGWRNLWYPGHHSQERAAVQRPLVARADWKNVLPREVKTSDIECVKRKIETGGCTEELYGTSSKVA